MAAKKEEYVLPSLNARMLVDLMNDFYQQPGVEEAYQQWLAERRAEKNRKRKEREDTADHHLPEKDACPQTVRRPTVTERTKRP